jgi:uncharacterized NAD(P)/FAD-binding protein YdhS
MTTSNIAVIGGGASGTLLSLHLLRHAPPATRITLIERNAPFGPGLAYGTGNPNHLLNVPAGRMSAFVDQPRHFVDWLERQPPQILDGLQPTDAAFVPRRLYGAYLRHLLNKAMLSSAPGRLELLHDTVTAIEAPMLRLASGHVILADIVVLAIGNDLPALCGKSALRSSPHWRANPWAPDALSSLDQSAPVLLVGTGLTMLDAVLTLLDQQHTGPIHAVSRRGLLPRPHVCASPAPPMELRLPVNLRDLTRIVRLHASEAGEAWRSVIDRLRPFTQEIWQALSIEERRRFLRHLRPWWDVHRHRMPPSVAARIDAARTSGQLQVHAGHLAGCYELEDGACVVLRLRSGASARLRVARVVDCSGPCTDITRSSDPLLRVLLRQGVVRPDPCRLGLDVTTSGALRSRDGAVSRCLFALGPLTRGAFWEITALPDIRRQSEILALQLVHVLRERGRQRDRILANV